MDLRAVDRRFLLPQEPQRILLGVKEAALAPALARTGVTSGGLAEPGGHPGTDVITAAMCRRRELAQALSHRPDAVIVTGAPSVTVRAPRGWSRTAYVVSPTATLMAVSDPVVLRHVTRDIAPAQGPIARARNRALSSRAGSVAATTTILARGSTVPWVLRVAVDAIGAPIPTRWFFQARPGGDGVRIVGHTFSGDSPRPTHVVKFHREATARPDAKSRPPEHAVLQLVRSRAGTTADKVVAPLAMIPTSIGPVMVEQAARGGDLGTFLRQQPREPLPDVVGSLLSWARRFGAETCRPTIRGDLSWLGERLRPYARGDLGARLDGMPTCLAHQDLACLNVMTDGLDFRVIDWETFTDEGLPLADITYLMTDVLVHRFGPTSLPDRVRWVLALWRGDLPESPLCRRWILEAGSAHHLRIDQVEALVVATWLLNYDGPGRVFGHLGQIGGAWLGDPDLGLSWSGLSQDVPRDPGRAGR